VKPPVFDYHRATGVDDALSVLRRHGSDAKILAGGQSLIPMLKLRLARPAMLVDINGITDLAYARVEGGALHIGATTRLYEMDSALADRHCPLVAAAVRYVGHPAIRHRGTVCGSLAHADPAAELPLAALCVDAELRVAGPNGRRVIPAASFFDSALTTTLAADELLCEVRVPVMAPGTGWSFMEFTKRAGDFAIAAAAITLDITPARTISRARVALGGVADRPVRCPRAEGALAGATASVATFRAAAAAAVDGLDPPSDVHGAGTFRRRIAAVLVERALTEAWGRSAPR